MRLMWETFVGVKKPTDKKREWLLYEKACTR